MLDRPTQRSAPAADDQGAVRILDRECQTAEEIGPVDPSASSSSS